MIYVYLLVTESSRQWVAERNLNAISYVQHADRNSIHILPHDIKVNILMVNRGRLSYIPLNKCNVRNDETVALVLTCFNGKSLNDLPWSKVEAHVERVHHHVVGMQRLRILNYFLSVTICGMML